MPGNTGSASLRWTTHPVICSRVGQSRTRWRRSALTHHAPGIRTPQLRAWPHPHVEVIVGPPTNCCGSCARLRLDTERGRRANRDECDHRPEPPRTGEFLTYVGLSEGRSDERAGVAASATGHRRGCGETGHACGGDDSGHETVDCLEETLTRDSRHPSLERRRCRSYRPDHLLRAVAAREPLQPPHTARHGDYDDRSRTASNDFDYTHNYASYRVHLQGSKGCSAWSGI